MPECFYIHVELKCKEKNASRNFSNEYKKDNRFPDIFKEFPDKEKPYQSSDKFYRRRFKRFLDNEKEIKDGSVQIELSQTPVSENGTVDCGK